MSDDFRVNDDDLLADRLVEVEMAPVIPIEKPDPDPKNFKPLPGDKIKLNAQDFGDRQKAGKIVTFWEINVALQGIFNSSDLNNVGCAYVWLSNPDYPRAKSLFAKALRKDPTNQIIVKNLSLLP